MEPVYLLVGYQLALLLMVVLLVDAAVNASRLKYVYSGLVYLVTAMWYLVDPIYTPTDYVSFTENELNLAFYQVSGFLLAFRVFVHVGVGNVPTQVLKNVNPSWFARSNVINLLMWAWATLWIAGVSLADFDVVNLMFPMHGRFSSVSMFGRGRFAGSTGFLLSSAAYVYMVICSGFGLVLVCTNHRRTKSLMLAMIGFTWPMYFLGGTRHLALAVAMPAVFATLLVKNWSRSKQIAFVVASGLIINLFMLAAIQFRQTGFGNAIQSGALTAGIVEARHQGLNMTQELMFINRYINSGELAIEWGGNYLGHLLNVVPRGLWPDKPFVGREFAMLRVGLYQGDVAATISLGIIGQGVANFGIMIGPLAPAFLLAMFGKWIVALPLKGIATLRVLLILFIFGSLPNVGRDISLFVLWPVVFAYVLVLFAERKVR